MNKYFDELNKVKDCEGFSRRNFYDDEIVFKAVQSTYFKKVEFINTHQVGAVAAGSSQEEMDFHNNGIYNFGNGFVRSWDHYCLNQI